MNNFELEYKHWAGGLGKSERTVKSYIGALKSTIPNWLSQAGLSQNNLLDILLPAELEVIAAKARRFDEFTLRDNKGKGMYSAALNSYQAFLNEINQVEVSRDIDEIIQRQPLDETEKARMIKTRLGQGQFRTELIQFWQGCCALTKYRQIPFLVASHIKPWRVSSDKERLDSYNGLLLLANVDKAFDYGYITFTEKGNILISAALEDHKLLGIGDEMQINLIVQHQDYMAYHREQVFKC